MRRRGFIRFFWVIPLAVVLVMWGIDRWPTGPAEGGPIHPPQASATPPTRLRLATFNIRSGVGLDDKLDLTRTAALLKPFDLIALQEVGGDFPWKTNQAVTLGKLLGLTDLFSPTERHLGFPVFGNAVLTRVKVDHWARTPLPNGYHMAHRQMLQLAVPFGNATLNVLVIHMGKKSDRQRQFAIATAAFKAMPEPAVMMGDMNTRPYDRMMVALLEPGEIHDVVGERIAPVDRVDFILTRGVRCTDAGLTQNDASDHPMAWADLEAGQ